MKVHGYQSNHKFQQVNPLVPIHSTDLHLSHIYRQGKWIYPIYASLWLNLVATEGKKLLLHIIITNHNGKMLCDSEAYTLYLRNSNWRYHQPNHFCTWNMPAALLLLTPEPTKTFQSRRKWLSPRPQLALRFHPEEADAFWCNTIYHQERPPTWTKRQAVHLQQKCDLFPECGSCYLHSGAHLYWAISAIILRTSYWA